MRTIEIKFTDAYTGKMYEIMCNRPGAEEIVQYKNKIAAGEGSEAKRKILAVKDLIYGIGEDQFTDDSGKYISSKEGSENYNKDWKKIVVERYDDLVLYTATSLYESMYIQKEERSFLLGKT